MTPVLEALADLRRLALVHDRPELAESAQKALDRSAGTSFRIVVMGEFKAGKSSLVNALVDAPVCAVDDDMATATRLEVGFANQAGARRWFRPTLDSKVTAVEIAPDEAALASTDPTTTLVRVGLPRQLLRSGLVLVDTPGVGGMGSAAAVVTASSLADAHAVLFVTDVSQGFTRAESNAILDATQRCAHVVIVATKIDVFPQWRDIVVANRTHLTNIGLDLPVVALSNHLRKLALETNDADLNRESRFPDLLDLINNRFIVSAHDAVQQDSLHAARRVYGHLREPIADELLLLEGAEDSERAKQAVDDARAEIEAFRERAAGWQQKLADGCTDMAAAVDIDLRNRFRVISQESEEQLDESDPDEIWHEFEPALYRSTAEALDQNLTLLRDRANQITRLLADAVTEDENDLIDLGGHLGEGTETGAVAERKEPKGAQTGPQQVFRAGYGSAMPILAIGGMALGVLGLGTMVLPIAAVMGVMGGRKAITDDRERQLTQRRQQARSAVKKYTDEALFRAATERKQEQRQVQRVLRDHFGARVKELATTRQRALQQAEAAAKTDENERRQRIVAVRAELVQVEDVARAMAAPT